MLGGKIRYGVQMKLGWGRLLSGLLILVVSSACQKANTPSSASNSAADEAFAITEDNWQLLDEAFRLVSEGTELAQDGKIAEALGIADSLDKTAVEHELELIHFLGNDIRIFVAIYRKEPEQISNLMEEFEHWYGESNITGFVRGIILMNQAVVQCQIHDYEKAKKLLENAKASMANSDFTEVEDYYGKLEFNFGEVFSQQEKDAEAMKAHRAALEWFRRAEPIDWKWVAQAKAAIGWDYFLQEILLNRRSG